MNSIAAQPEEAGLDQAQARLAELLGTTAPVPLAVMRRALEDEKFAFYLMMTKESPELQKQLLNDPRTAQYAAAEGAASGGADREPAAAGSSASAASPSPAVPQPHSTVDLLVKASTAFAQWGTTGFQAAGEAVKARRWAACQACVYLVDPPKSLIYQGLRILAGRDTKICSACGCAANKKVGIPTEHCPVRSSDDPELSLWGEPWRDRKVAQ